jgi:hypothetical protein
VADLVALYEWPASGPTTPARPTILSAAGSRDVEVRGGYHLGAHSDQRRLPALLRDFIESCLKDFCTEWFIQPKPTRQWALMTVLTARWDSINLRFWNCDTSNRPSQLTGFRSLPAPCPDSGILVAAHSPLLGAVRLLRRETISPIINGNHCMWRPSHFEDGSHCKESGGVRGLSLMIPYRSLLRYSV